MDLDQRIPGWGSARARLAPANQPQHLAVINARRNVDVQRLAVRQGHCLAGAVDRLEELDREAKPQIPSGHRNTGPGATPQKLGQNVLIHEISEARVRGVRLLRAVSRKIAVVPLPGPLCARGLNLAAVKTGSFLRGTQQIIGRGDRFEAVQGLGVAGVQVQVVLLGQPAVGCLDLVGRRIGGDAERIRKATRSRSPSHNRASALQEKGSSFDSV